MPGSTRNERLTTRPVSEMLATLGWILDQDGVDGTERARLLRAKARWLHLQRSPAELAAMRAVKDALDPAAILNPGCLFA